MSLTWPFTARGGGADEGTGLVDPVQLEAGGAGAASGAGAGSGFFSRLPAFPARAAAAAGLGSAAAAASGSGDAGAGAGAAAGEGDDLVASLCGEMSYQTRVYGFIACFAMGTFLSISSSFFVPMILIKPAKFAVPYTLGNVLSVLSSLFLVGPRRFFNTMFGEDRRAASIVYLTTLLLTLVAALVLHSGLLTFAFIFIQFASYMWLMASYIPFGRQMLASLSTKCTTWMVGA
jgi:hypothetical protein